MDIFEELTQKIKGKNIKIVFPEGEEERILKAVVRLKEENLITPIVLGKVSDVEKTAQKINKSLDGIKIIDPNTADDFDEMVEKFLEIRKGKNTKDDALRLLKDVNYYGTMLVKTNKANGMVSGAVHSTGDTVRPALQIIDRKSVV